MAGMAPKLKEMITRVQTWPEDRQEDVARLLSEMEEQHRSELRLTPEQAAEVAHRLANPSDRTIPAEDVFRKLRAS